jgi:hypothetical protein
MMEETHQRIDDNKRLTVLGELRAYVECHKEPMQLWIGADAFEYDNENYPTWDLEELLFESMDNSCTHDGMMDAEAYDRCRIVAEAMIEYLDSVKRRPTDNAEP